MCVIVHLPAQSMLKYDQLRNAVHNNWHSYGLVTKIDGKLDIRRVVPASGEIDPDEVQKELSKDIEFERYLHLRHNTAGATNEKNCHPFDVFYSEKRHVTFMHNGTLNPYVPKKFNEHGASVDDPEGPSDSYTFATKVIQPLMTKFAGDNGHGDIHDSMFVEIMKKYWTGSNRGILISSDQEPLFIDDWKEIEGEEGVKLRVSNTTYFDKVTRGPEFSRLEAAKAEAARANKGSGVPTVKPKGHPGNFAAFAALKDFDFNPRYNLESLTSSPAGILNDWELYCREGAACLGYATKEEIDEIYRDERSCKILMDWIFTDYLKMFEELTEIEDKHEKATKMIATIVANRNAMEKKAS